MTTRPYRELRAIRHGTRAGYQRGCRCDGCRLADNQYQREGWRRRRIERGLPVRPIRADRYKTGVL